MKCSAKAKINLSLDVVSKRPDGYHNLEMIMQEINLSDTIYVDKSENITLWANKNLPIDENNIAFRVATDFFEYTKIKGGVNITIEKNIPIGAGLGGGSSDGATVLKALNEIYNTNLTQAELINIGKKSGADIPFFIVGGCCVAAGIGEVLTPIPMLKNMCLLLVKPDFSVNTGEIFKSLNLSDIQKRPDTKNLVNALKHGDNSYVAENLVNVLEPVTAALHREIYAVKKSLLQNGAIGSVMSGSGSTVFGLFNTVEKAEIARNIMDDGESSYYVVKL